jgi:UDP-N-acetylmuramate--alanine ligase
VITNIEHDHPDCYPTLAAVIEAFNAFADRVTECMVVCADSPEAADLVRPHLIRITYGLHPTADWRAEEIRPNSAGGMDFLIFKRSDLLGLVRTRLPGEHNVRNVLGAVAVADYMDVPFATIRQALTGYHGVGRRFEILGTQAGVTVIDDYAHHPTEIKATLAAARMQFPDGKIWAVFQPHTYSRLRALIAAYTGSFDDADQVIVTEVFAAREEQDEEMTGEKLAQEVRHHNVRFLPDFEEISGYLAQQVSPGDVVVTLSAGDANKVGKLLLKRLSEGKEGMGNAEG